MRLYLFGVLRISHFDNLKTGRKQTQQPLVGNVARLLAYLALQAYPQTRSQIAGALFPNVSEEQARRLLTHTLYRLKKEIGDDYLLTEREQISLHNVWIDAEQFVQMLSEGPPFSNALQLYSADLLMSLDDEWLLGQRARLREQFLQAVARDAVRLEGINQLAEALKLAQRWAEVDCFDEAAQLTLMRLFARLGKPLIALQHYEAFKQFLWDELAVEPLLEMEEMTKQIRRERQLVLAIDELPVFIGRKQPRAQLIRLLEKRQGLALISGAAGIGKTRLLDELVDAAAWRQLVLARGAAMQSTEEVPYAALITALRMTSWQAVLPDMTPLAAKSIAQLLNPERGNRIQSISTPLALALRQLIELLTRTGPLLILLDDIQWADDGTWELIVELVQLTARLPLILLLAFRSELLRQPTRQPLLSAIDRDYAPLQIALEGLTVEESAEIIRTQDPTATRSRIALLYKRSAGNPLILHEMLSDPSDTSATLEALLQQRLQTLSANGQQAVQVAAVLDEPFAYSTWQLIFGQQIPIDELLVNGVILPAAQPLHYRYQHDVVRQYVYDNMPDSRRIWHRCYASWLENGDGESAEIAHHYEQAGEHVLAAHYWQQAAAHSLRLGVRSVAAAQCDRALKLASSTDRLKLRLIALQIAQLEAWSGKHADEAEAIEQQAITAGDVEVQHGVAMAKLKYLAAMDRLDELAAVGEQALRLAHQMADPDSEIATRVELVQLHIGQRRDLEAAEPLAQGAVALANSLVNRPDLQIAALLSLAYLHFSRVDLVQARAVTDKAAALYDRHPDPTLEVGLRTQQAFVAQLALDNETALAMQRWLANYYLETRNMAKRKGALWMVAQVAQNCALYEEAIAAAEQMLHELRQETTQDDSAHAMMARAMLGENLVLADDLESAEEVLTPLINWLPSAERGMRTLRGWETVGSLYFAQHKYAEAYAMFDCMMQLAGEPNPLTPTPRLMHIEAAHFAGKHTKARRNLMEIEQRLDLTSSGNTVSYFYYLRFLVEGNSADLAHAYNRILRSALQSRAAQVRHATLTRVPVHQKIVLLFQNLSEPLREWHKLPSVNGASMQDVLLTLDDGLTDGELGKVQARQRRVVRLTGEALLQGSTLTLTAIAKLLGVTTRTLTRDVAALAKVGVLLRAEDQS